MDKPCAEKKCSNDDHLEGVIISGHISTPGNETTFQLSMGFHTDIGHLSTFEAPKYTMINPTPDQHQPHTTILYDITIDTPWLAIISH